MSLFPFLKNSTLRWKQWRETLNHAARGKLFLSFVPAEGGRCFSNSVSVKKSEPGDERKKLKAFLVLGFVTVSAGTYFLVKKKTSAPEKLEVWEPGAFLPNLPVYTQVDLENHKTKENRIWVTYKNGVYDVTDFVDKHPGGKKILLAAGSSVEPYWALHGEHHKKEVYAMLEELRIGNIKCIPVQKEGYSLDLYSNEPDRQPILKPVAITPFNAEPPPSLLVDKFYTPNCIFYVRNHLPVPKVDAEDYRLYISGIGVGNRYLTLEEIKKFPKHTISAVMQCAGNRRREMSRTKPVKGLEWKHGAIGNATWGGARLIDVLKGCGLDLNRTDIEHVQFEGLDMGPDGICYGASIPSEKAFDPQGDVILAYEMNGEVISQDHGFPVRLVAPGIVGARNVKWVSRIILSDKESPSHWQQNDYKAFSPSTTWEDVDFSSAPAIQELPVNSAICVPEDGEEVEVVSGGIVCKGYACSGGGRRIIRVDVTIDKGKTWHVASLDQAEDKHFQHWAWTLWSAYIPVPEKEKTVEIWVKAVDSSYNTQPESFENIWNIRGVINNAYHRVTVTIPPKKES